MATMPAGVPDPRFASDNAAGVDPAILEALARANDGPALGYGHDRYTESALVALRRHFGDTAEALLVWGGTAANVIGLRAVTDSYHAVLCAETAHLWSDECGAPERFLGGKLLPVATAADGKMRAEDVSERLRGRGIVHFAQARVLSLAQATELGTVYTVEELRSLIDFCHANDLLVHVDGARLANAAARLGIGLGALTTDLGVDLLSLGATKNGVLGAEVILFLRAGLAPAAAFHRKQGMQLASKMRFLAVQIERLLTDDLWRRNAEQANAMAERLYRGVQDLPELEVIVPVETNALFVRMPRHSIERLRQRYSFAVWREHPERPLVRWMTAFDTSPAEVDAFVAAVAAELAA